MLLARRCAHLALAVVLAIFAVAPHQHEGLVEHVRPTVTNLGTCDEPDAQHLHASKEVHAQPCVGCVRHHSSGALNPLAGGAEPLPAVAVFTAVRTCAYAATVVFTPLRAPPAAQH
jgi:hypothetical protein